MAIETNITSDDWATGTDHVFEFTIWTDDTQTTRRNISGMNFRWELKKVQHSPTIMLPKTMGAGSIVITDGSNGRVDVLTNRADTVAFVPGTYYYSLYRIDTSQETLEAYGTIPLVRGRAA